MRVGVGGAARCDTVRVRDGRRNVDKTCVIDIALPLPAFAFRTAGCGGLALCLCLPFYLAAVFDALYLPSHTEFATDEWDVVEFVDRDASEEHGMAREELGEVGAKTGWMWGSGGSWWDLGTQGSLGRLEGGRAVSETGCRGGCRRSESVVVKHKLVSRFGRGIMTVSDSSRWSSSRWETRVDRDLDKQLNR